MKTFFLYASVLLVTSGLAISQQRFLTVQEAHELALAAIPIETHHAPGFGLDDFSMPGISDFYFIEITLDNPGGSVVYDHFAVDKKTGDVWSAVVCRRVSSADLKKAQAAIRKKIGLTNADYRKLKKPGPMCE